MSNEPEGLYMKYRVTKVGSDAPLSGCFVLRPKCDPAALAALAEYARVTTNQQLARDLREWLEALERMGKT